MKTLFDPMSYIRNGICWQEVRRDDTHVWYKYVTDYGYRSTVRKCPLIEWERHILASEPSDEDIV